MGVAFGCYASLQLYVAMSAFQAFGPAAGGPFWGGLLFTAAGAVLEGIAHYAFQAGPPAAPAQLTATWSRAKFAGTGLYFVLMFGCYFLLCEVITVMGYRPPLRAQYLKTSEAYKEGHDLFVAAHAAHQKGSPTLT